MSSLPGAPAPPPPEWNETSPPPGWGGLALSQYLDIAQENRWQTFHTMKEATERILALDQCFALLSDNLNTRIAGEGETDFAVAVLTPLLLIRSTGAFRVAAGCVMAGQAVEAYPLLRAALDYAAYAFLMHARADLAVLWLGADKNPKLRRKARKAFTPERAIAAMTGAAKATGKVLAAMYEALGDFGGRPATVGTLAGMRVQQHDDGAFSVGQSMIQGAGPAVDFAHLTLCSVGATALQVFGQVFPTPFQEQHLGERVAAIRAAAERAATAAAQPD